MEFYNQTARMDNNLKIHHRRSDARNRVLDFASIYIFGTQDNTITYKKYVI
jgi:hypothetical protein